MKVKKFELWLDESGDFKCDSDTSKNPSLVGGVLAEKGQISETAVRDILGSDFVHGNEISRSIYGSYVLKVLNDLHMQNGQIVIFENKERLEVVDGSTTYLNVISEGIIQLMQMLSAIHGYIDLEVLVAVRLNMEKADYVPGDIIKQDEYIKRLQEKIIMGLARRTLSNNRNWTWSLNMSSARTNHKLMASDIVCNSYITRNSKKFNDEQREELKKFYDEAYFFTVFEKSTSSHIKALLADGAIGEAIFEIYTSEENINKKELMNIAFNRLSMFDDESVKNQLLNIKIRIGTLIKLDNNFKKSKNILINIQDEFIPILEELNINGGVFPIDIYLYLLTVYTHEGNVKLEEKQIDLCQTALKRLANRWESIDYYFMFKIRQAVHSINIFDYDMAVKSMDEIIAALDDTLGLFSMVQGIGEIYSEIKSDLMGKAIGTRLQARRYIIRNNKDALSDAHKDSDRAINEFMLNSDKTRQYQYRSEIECEGKNYMLAVDYLCRSMGTSYENENSLLKILNIISKKQTATEVYSLMHYVRIMAEASVGNDEKLADMMFKVWNEANLTRSEFVNNGGNDHPWEIIFWKLGTYMCLAGSIAAALKYYNEAINICSIIPERLTLRAIGLGIMSEKAAALGNAGIKYNKEFETSVKDFVNNYNKFLEIGLPEKMEKYFLEWKQEIDNLNKLRDTSEKISLLWKLSRKITY